MSASSESSGQAYKSNLPTFVPPLKSYLDRERREHGQLALWGAGSFLRERIDPDWLAHPDIHLVDSALAGGLFGSKLIESPDVIRLLGIKRVIISVYHDTEGHFEIESRLREEGRITDINSLSTLNPYSPDPSLDGLAVPPAGPDLADLDNRLLIDRESCPVCLERYAVPVRYLFPCDLDCKVLLRHCLNCRSFWSAPYLVGSGYAGNTSSVTSILHHLNVMQRNLGLAETFFQAMAEIGDFSSVLEIGCGIGTTLAVAAEKGKKVLGYDIDAESIEAGRLIFKLPLKAEEWNAESVGEKYDLVLCISTLEHFTEPRPMIHELAAYAQKMKSLLFICVPLFETSGRHLRHLITADPRDLSSPLRWPLGHYTLFSLEGLTETFSGYGGRLEYIRPAGTYSGLICDFRSDSNI